MYNSPVRQIVYVTTVAINSFTITIPADKIQQPKYAGTHTFTAITYSGSEVKGKFSGTLTTNTDLMKAGSMTFTKSNATDIY